jgi:hypothetical protein
MLHMRAVEAGYFAGFMLRKLRCEPKQGEFAIVWSDRAPETFHMLMVLVGLHQALKRIGQWLAENRRNAMARQDGIDDVLIDTVIGTHLQ